MINTNSTNSPMKNPAILQLVVESCTYCPNPCLDAEGYILDNAHYIEDMDALLCGECFDRACCHAEQRSEGCDEE